MASRFEHDMDDGGGVNVAEKSETAIENEDESDQAKASGFLSLSCISFFSFTDYIDFLLTALFGK